MSLQKSRLPSRHVSLGPSSAPHRSYYYAMGLTDAEIARPFVAVATCWNEAAPCNITLGRQAQAVKKGREGGGRDASRIHDHHSDRWHRNGASGHESVAREPRPHCGFGRIDNARPTVTTLLWVWQGAISRSRG